MADQQSTGARAPEAWLGGPVGGVPPLLMPAAHALLQARTELHQAAGGLTHAQVWLRPGGAASIGFHLRHLAGSLDRLLTYARAEPLSAAQRAALVRESETGAPDTAEQLLGLVDAGVEEALEQLRRTDERTLLDFRGVGRAQLPSNVLGLVFHAAEHTQRHTGQVIATAKIVRGMALAD